MTSYTKSTYRGAASSQTPPLDSLGGHISEPQNAGYNSAPSSATPASFFQPSPEVPVKAVIIGISLLCARSELPDRYRQVNCCAGLYPLIRCRAGAKTCIPTRYKPVGSCRSLQRRTAVHWLWQETCREPGRRQKKKRRLRYFRGARFSRRCEMLLSAKCDL
ncbi:hypothetical protein EJ05DRAFT_478976 [Pseudovirgaria hyperparasitica]|uniref:Uncharacterized protein n=1 Tax=Pseudovirgaria hyperparasitica TaxID=470096 RepID=A0A6A6VY96_9PEZI|nr:uncharacterized protein EJ05DRAFT_478976 [Pseudovirgaria hyperparasitica]KAF2755175.1 hypothetical protein EJ05DRAFT_478976 [Pseudovirgaria hyperparasitica]